MIGVSCSLVGDGDSVVSVTLSCCSDRACQVKVSQVGVAR